MREDLEREVATQLRVSEKTIEKLLGQGSVGSIGAGTGSGGGSGAGATITAPVLDGAERVEAAFLALCIALPERGAALLAELDLDATFSSQLMRAAASELRSDIDATVPDGEGGGPLAALLTELAVRASTLTAGPAGLEVAVRQLQLARIERQIDAVRAERWRRYRAARA